MIYFIKTIGADFVKIGYAKDIKKRLLKISSDNPYNLKVINQIEGGTSLENDFHHYFKDYWVKGEWFKYVPEMETIVEVPKRPKTYIKHSRSTINKYNIALNKLNEEMRETKFIDKYSYNKNIHKSTNIFKLLSQHNKKHYGTNSQNTYKRVKRLLHLYYIQKKSHSEISRIMNIRENHISYYLSRYTKYTINYLGKEFKRIRYKKNIINKKVNK